MYSLRLIMFINYQLFWIFQTIHGTLQSTPKRFILEQRHCCHLTSARPCCCFCWTTWLLQMSPVNCLAYYLSHLFNLSGLLTVLVDCHLQMKTNSSSLSHGDSSSRRFPSMLLWQWIWNCSTAASAATCISPACWLLLASKNRNCIVMTLLLL